MLCWRMVAPGHSTRLFLPPVPPSDPTSTRTLSLRQHCLPVVQLNLHRMICLQNRATQVSSNHILAKKPGGGGVLAHTDFDPTLSPGRRCLHCLSPSVRIAAGFFPERKPF